jgi:hypothetical protein
MMKLSGIPVRTQRILYVSLAIFCLICMTMTFTVNALSTFTAGPAISVTGCGNTSVNMSLNHAVNLDPGDQLTFTESVNGSQVRIYLQGTGPYTANWTAHFFGGTYNIAPPYNFTSYWEVTSNGTVIIRYLIQGQCSALNTGTATITLVDLSAAPAEVEDDSLRQIFFDGRINSYDTGNSVVLFGKPDADDSWRLEVYNADQTGMLFVVYPETIAAVPECPESNTLIQSDEATGISLWRLTERTMTAEGVLVCPFQLNAPSTEAGKTYVIIFDTLFPNSYYESGDEWIGN